MLCEIKHSNPVLAKIYVQRYTRDDFVKLLMSTSNQQLRRLHQLGARKMVIHNIEPLGCISLSKGEKTSDH
ncbi:hypothetical protein FRX31_028186 [Thalictrum thalictroides]|uniref:Uncharacterized protein n=1 Tax=Thalictrum thalictroides TaxID=46969 RepID=A0A7J6VBV2_THATH|nr:hypothetical protein FRX31_028186 [Thalictrum thalictroides]